MEVIWIQDPFACNFQSHYKLAVRKMQSLFFDPSANIHFAYPLVEKKISTAEGILLRVNRSIQAEGVFAAIKEDLNFRRFLTRGNANVTVEWYLVSMAYYFSHTHTAPPGCGSEADVSDASPRLKICLLAVKMFILQRESIVCALVDRQNKQI